jgi:hypothetical protein
MKAFIEETSKKTYQNIEQTGQKTLKNIAVMSSRDITSSKARGNIKVADGRPTDREASTTGGISEGDPKSSFWSSMVQFLLPQQSPFPPVHGNMNTDSMRYGMD